MATFPINGIIQKVNPIETVGQNNTKKQTFILRQPGFVDQFGEKKGKDQDFEITLMGDAIAKFDLLSKNAAGQKAKTEVFINSNSFTNKEGKIGYIMSANLAKIELMGAAAVPAGEPGKDDLPF